MSKFWTQMNAASKTFKDAGSSITEAQVKAKLDEVSNEIKG